MKRITLLITLLVLIVHVNSQVQIKPLPNSGFEKRIRNFVEQIKIVDTHDHLMSFGAEPQQMAAGVRLDDAISGFNIVENIFVKSQKGVFGAIQIHGGKDNIVEGNYFFECNAAISQSAWEDRRWRIMVKKEQLKNDYWNSKLWLSTFPDLNDILENADKNYYTDNLIVNCKTPFLRKAHITPVFNCITVLNRNLVVDKESLENYMLPWHHIPVQYIGIYKQFSK